MIGRKDPVVDWGKPVLISLLLLTLSCEEKVHDPIIVKQADSIGVSRWPWEDVGLNNMYPMRMVKSGGYVYVAAGVDGIWRLDGEDRWKYLGLKDTVAGQSPYGGVLSLDVYEGELFAGLRSAISIDSNQRVGVWRMGPNSSEWVPGDSGIRVQEWASSAVLDIVRSPANPQLMVTGPGSIYQSSNEGKSWELRYPNNRSGFAPFLRFVWHSVNQHVVWGLGVSNRMGGLIHHSVDGGVTWEIISRLPADAFSSGYYSMAFDAADPNIVYLGTSGAVMKSTNGGQDWVSGSMALLFRNSLGRSFQELVSHPRRGGVLFAAADTNVYLSEDAGETVYELPSPTNKRIYSMIYDAENDWLLVASYEGIFRLREPLNVPRERYK